LHIHVPAESSRAGHRQNTSARTHERAGSIPLGPSGRVTPPSLPPTATSFACRYNCLCCSSTPLCALLRHARPLFATPPDAGPALRSDLVVSQVPPRLPSLLPSCVASLPSVRVRSELLHFSFIRARPSRALSLVRVASCSLRPSSARTLPRRSASARVLPRRELRSSATCLRWFRSSSTVHAAPTPCVRAHRLRSSLHCSSSS
jgi:hypothetical protein